MRVAVLGATGTVGVALCETLLSEGATVDTFGRSVSSAPGDHYVLDLCDPVEDQIAPLKAYGLVVLASGVDSTMPVSQLEPAEFERVLRINCGALLEFLRLLPPGAEASVYAISSDVLDDVPAASAAYAASKGALEFALRGLVADSPHVAVRVARLGFVGVPMGGPRSATPLDRSAMLNEMALDFMAFLAKASSKTLERGFTTWRPAQPSS